MGDDFVMNDVNDRFHQYRNIMGVPSRRRIFCSIGWIVSVLSLILIAFVFMTVKANAASKETIKRNSTSNESMGANATNQGSSLQWYKSFPSALNVSLDPCVDFYNFSCGLWSQNNPIPTYDARITTFSILQDIVSRRKKSIFENTKGSKDLPNIVNNAVQFYNACIETNTIKFDNLQLLNQYFNQIGGWPILKNDEWNETLFDWFHASAFLIKHLDLHTVIGVYTIDSDQSGGRNVLYLKSPSILDDEENTLSNMASVQMLYVIINVLNGNDLNSDFSNGIDSLTIAESKWRKLLSPLKKASDPIYMTIEELSGKIPDFDWLRYFQLITNDTLLELNETLTMNDTIAIGNFDFLNKVVAVLNSDTFSKIELANLFGWYIVKDIWILIPDVPERYSKLNDYSTDDMKNAAINQCYDLVVDIFSLCLDYLYVKNSSFGENQDGRVLTKYLKSAFKDIIQKSVWPDNETKTLTLNRLNSMQHIIGFPDYLKNKTELDRLYENFPSMNGNILNYYFKIQEYFAKRRYLSLKIPTNDTKWILPRPVSDVSAYYIVNKNTLVYPISLHNPPFYYFNGPWYLNFGAVGSVIGHEMMHGFDIYGGRGNILNVTWLSKQSKKYYLELAECFENQYNNYDSTGLYKNNGTCTLRENIADNEGLRLAFKAYKKHAKDFGSEENYQTLNSYTPDQMFFISYASVWCSKISLSLKKTVRTASHSFPELRVNEAVSNSKSFAVAFSCPEGSPMNPVRKCSLW